METQPQAIENDRRPAAAIASLLNGWPGKLVLLCLLTTLALTTQLYFQWGGEALIEASTDLVQIFVYLTGFLLTLRAARHTGLQGRARRAWQFFAAACLSYTSASVLWAYFELVTETQPFPSWADPFYILYYVLMLAGLLLVAPRARSREERFKSILDAAIVTVGSLMLIWYHFLEPIAKAGSEDDLLTALSLVYPVCDLMLLFGIAVVLFKRPEPMLKRSMNAMLAGIFVIFFADLLFCYQNLNGTYRTGTLADALYTVSAFFLVLAAHIQHLDSASEVKPAAAIAQTESQIFTWLPYLAIGAGYFLLLSFVYDRLGDVLSQLIVIAGVLAALVVMRQVMAIRESVRHRAALGDLQERFQGIYRSSKDAIGFASFDGTLIDVNDAFAALVGYTKDELLQGKTYHQLTPPEYQADIAGHMSKVLEFDQPAEYEKEYFRKDGSRVPIAVTSFAVKGNDGKPMGIAAIIRDITERKRNENQLLHNALHDALTGLPNRALFLEHLKSAINRSARSAGGSFAVLFLDFDRFKIINDSLGHLEGDKLLIQIAARLKSSLRQGDIVARLGGDEFTILLDKVENAEHVECVVARIEKTLSDPFRLTEKEVFTSASIGIAMSSAHYKKPDEMLRDADTAMYYAKEAGKARHHFFTPAMHERANRRLQLENEMRPALERGEFRLFYQPIVEIENRRVTGFEALVRWQHPERGLIAPSEFVPIAEETGLIVPLSEWILREGCRQLRCWQNRKKESAALTMSINLSCKQFVQHDLYGRVAAAIIENRIEPACLHLEVTESSLLKDSKSAIEVMNRLRELGVKFSIDDFGTGYSSLSYLHQLPIDFLKIDRSFVSELNFNRDNEEIVRSIMTLAESLSIEVIAEGVENYEELEMLRNMRCRYGQGYLFSRPEAPEQIERFLESLSIDNRPAASAGPLALLKPLLTA